ncbi:Protein of unknown function (DUF498/DUF598) [Geosmithia morbida]|uniref:NADH dehydrogenase [ubiquinone] 1 alpha subcomplex assembly factor 3 n=1 Tax=Geosmithia morbida TaxID=1094350 RepID=A0A9P4YMJ9_9HYPO|nr:Protein of unknown function (DUF498/DUF598) [Geosmithia morbida]KAF4119721.1 Protein of unknown function (DUF498/DUF598) [Geosmithia morbida]
MRTSLYSGAMFMRCAARVAITSSSSSSTAIIRQLPAATSIQQQHHHHHHDHHRYIHTSDARSKKPSGRSSRKNGDGQDDRARSASAARPPTDIASLDVLGSVPAPSTSVDVCMQDGFGLNSGVTISGGDGAILVNGEAFSWRPWEANDAVAGGGGGAAGEMRMRLVNAKGQFEVPAESLGMLDMLWPRPDLLIIGVGKDIRPLSPKTRMVLADMGYRVEVLDTRNAASQFNMLATERGASEVAAVLIPIGWKEGVGASY